MDKKQIDEMYGDFQRIGAFIDWLKNSTAYQVCRRGADPAKFEAALAKWEAKGIRFVVRQAVM